MVWRHIGGVCDDCAEAMRQSRRRTQRLKGTDAPFSEFLAAVFPNRCDEHRNVTLVEEKPA